MQEFLFIRLNELILLIYLLSIACYFFDFVSTKHRIKTIGFVTLGVVWVLVILCLLILLLSIACYFCDCVRKKHRITTIVFVTLGVVWMLQTISLSLYINVTKQIPLGNIFDVFFALAWLIISISIVISVIKQIN